MEIVRVLNSIVRNFGHQLCVFLLYHVVGHAGI
jgi:hypothetical protein